MRDVGTGLTKDRAVAVLLGCAVCLTIVFGIGYQLAAKARNAHREAPRYTEAQGPSQAATITPL